MFRKIIKTVNILQYLQKNYKNLGKLRKFSEKFI